LIILYIPKQRHRACHRFYSPFCNPAGSGGVGFGGDVFSGFTVRAATVAGRRAGSVARLVLSLSLGVASSSSRILLVSPAAIESSESLRQMESRLLMEVDDNEDDGLGWHSSSFVVCCSSSTSLGLDSRVRTFLDGAWRSLMALACVLNIYVYLYFNIDSFQHFYYRKFHVFNLLLNS